MVEVVVVLEYLEGQMVCFLCGIVKGIAIVFVVIEELSFSL